MVKIRLKRVGKVKQPSYRVVVADQRSPRDGRIIEAIGHYNPRSEPSIVSIDTDRAVHWLSVGAQPSDQVRKLLEISGAWAVFKGEAPPAPAGEIASTTKAKKATPSASVKVTPAASVEDEETPAAEAAAPAEDAE
jgi:small subunit ribosomal protein S16